MRARASGALLACLLLAAGAGACGVPISASPHRISHSALPQALLELRPPATSPTGTQPTTSKEVPIDIYLIQDVSGTLAPVVRQVSPPVTVQKVLDQLEAGPLSVDYHNGDESAVSPRSHLVAVGPVDHGVATVRLDQSFTRLTGEAPVDELGQIVWSLTKAPLHTTAVRFVGNGGALPVETGDGVFVNRPVTEKDYKLLAPQG